ncbi:UNVERIFIED_CONTAM: hypothetical protein K2H54_077893 [Gekko kuhli]
MNRAVGERESFVSLTLLCGIPVGLGTNPSCRTKNKKMGQVIYPGICLLGFLLLNPLVEVPTAFANRRLSPPGCKNDTVEARARCPHGAFFHRQFCYQYFDKPVTWYDAEIECQALKTGPEVHLVSILSSAEGRIILLYLKSKRASNVWFGLQCVYSNGAHVLITMLWTEQVVNPERFMPPVP